MKPLSPLMRQRLQAAYNEAASLVRGARGESHPAHMAIERLVQNHGANFRRGDPNTLRCCSVTSSCTFNADQALLKAWMGNATLRLAAAEQEQSC